MHDMKAFKEKLESIAKGSDFYINESMREHTSFRIGGPADIFSVVSPGDIPGIVLACRESGIPCTVLGNGSNVLVSDKGIRGVVLCLGDNASHTETIPEREGYGYIKAEAGAKLSSLSKLAMEEGLSGLEFASGIPGTLGGALVMNAGAYGGEMKDVVEYVTCIESSSLNAMKIPGEECDFSYRHSIFQNSDYIITGALLKLPPGEMSEISGKMEEFKISRKEKQPLEYPSAGSTFKRPEGYFAGKLISDCGLKGFSVGGAVVSEKHAGFVINTGNATASEVRALMDAVKDRVYEQFGVELVPEVKFVGEYH